MACIKNLKKAKGFDKLPNQNAGAGFVQLVLLVISVIAIIYGISILL